MKRFGVLILAAWCAFAAGCSTAPEVQAAHAKQQEALINLRGNLQLFADAALTDLQTALLAQIDREFAERRAALIDANNRVDITAYDKELAEAAAARDRDRAKVAAQMAKFREIEQDLDGAIAVGAAIDKYLNRKTFTTHDAVALMQEIAAILEEK
jgi:hypothetical protein